MSNLVPYSSALARLAAEARARGRMVRSKAHGLATRAKGAMVNAEVLKKEGASLGTHAAVAIADNGLGDITIPIIGVKVAPSTLTGAAALAAMVFFKGSRRVYARHAFQGVLHRKLSKLVDTKGAAVSGVLAGVLSSGGDAPSTDGI